MEDPKQPYRYTAGDLERYISGQMPREEMHRLEKAALDDPFLADALEGMMLSGGDEAWKDLGELRNNLRLRVEGPESAAGSQPMAAGSGSAGDAGEPADTAYRMQRPAPAAPEMPVPRIGWSPWRIAASVALLIGLGLLTTWLVQRQSAADSTIASRVAIQNQSDTAAENDATQAEGVPTPLSAMADTQAVAASPSVTAPSPITPLDKKEPTTGSRKTDSAVTAIAASPVTTAPTEQTETAISKAAPPVAAADTRSREALPGAATENRARALPSASGKITGPYVYTGQVRNTEGQPLSFVNIRLEPAGTSQYTDARGQFRILSADSNLTMHLKAYGYANKAAQLQAGRQTAPVTLTMQPGTDRAKAIAAAKPKASSKEEMTTLDEEKSDTTGVPEAEPRDGWAAYALYLLNNLRVPKDAFLQKLHGTVDVSFLVDANGRLSDFRVEKSLSPSCDREAVRLVREGPPWDLYNSDRPLRARVTVVF